MYSALQDGSPQCTQCPGGLFCDRDDIQWDDIIANGDDYKCDEGYFCKEGCKISNPTRSSGKGVTSDIWRLILTLLFNMSHPCSDCNSLVSNTGGTCSRNNFCPIETMSPFPCPIGEYQDNSAPADWSERGECITCEDGTDCQIPEAGGGAVKRDCPKGYYCLIENNVLVTGIH